jgi:hypothetical protein
MSDLVERYRLYAAECVRLAQDVSVLKQKLTLLDMAQNWLGPGRPSSRATTSAPVMMNNTPVASLCGYSVSGPNPPQPHVLRCYAAPHRA